MIQTDKIDALRSNLLDAIRALAAAASDGDDAAFAAAQERVSVIHSQLGAAKRRNISH